MKTSDLMDLAVLEKRKYNYLNEVMDLSRQIAEALDRNDQVSVRMLVAMRQDPILHLEEVSHSQEERKRALPLEDQERLSALLAGASPVSAEESMLLDQTGTVRRLLERVLELDRRINRRLAGNASFYKS